MLPPIVFVKSYISAAASTSFSEQITEDPRLKGNEVITSAIARHLLDSGYKVSVSNAFKIINRNRSCSVCQRQSLSNVSDLTYVYRSKV